MSDFASTVVALTLFVFAICAGIGTVIGVILIANGDGWGLAGLFVPAIVSAFCAGWIAAPRTQEDSRGA